MRRAGKRISQIIVRQKSVHFFGKEYCVKCARKRNAGKEKQKRVNCTKGSCYQTPLYDHVLGNKRDNDKDEVCTDVYKSQVHK
jgi:hypothetical protein